MANPRSSGFPKIKFSNTGLIFIVTLVVVAYALLTKSGHLSVQLQPPQVSKTTGQPPLTGPTPTPTPTRLREGKETYSISQGSDARGPKISSLTLDPLDPKVNQKQTLTAHVVYDQPVTNVSIELTSDNKKRTLPLVLDSGTSVNGDWQVMWIVDDTILYKYIVNISAVGGGIKNTVQVAPRQ